MKLDFLINHPFHRHPVPTNNLILQSTDCFDKPHKCYVTNLHYKQLVMSLSCTIRSDTECTICR